MRNVFRVNDRHTFDAPLTQFDVGTVTVADQNYCNRQEDERETGLEDTRC